MYRVSVLRGGFWYRLPVMGGWSGVFARRFGVRASRRADGAGNGALKASRHAARWKVWYSTAQHGTAYPASPVRARDPWHRDEQRSNGGGAHRAPRPLTHGRCLSGAATGRAASSAVRPRCEQRSAVGLSGRPRSRVPGAHRAGGGHRKQRTNNSDIATAILMST